ncbi:MAG: hypothetical protein WAN65_09900 [Candidatus Sulfotelmatobacter sp.]
MNSQIPTNLICSLFGSALLFALSLTTPVNAASCPDYETGGGTCRSHPGCDTGDTSKHCRDTIKSDGYHCVCRTGSDDRPHEPGLSLGIGIGPGGGLAVGVGPEGGGIGFDFSSGGYCDRWGCPGDYWGFPVFYGPVYYDGEWYNGPVYYREYDGGYEYWVHGGWHRDEWRGERPDWARDVHYGPALGHDYYRSDEFRHDAERYHHGDHPDHPGNDRSDHEKLNQGDHSKDDKGDHHGAGDSSDH